MLGMQENRRGDDHGVHIAVQQFVQVFILLGIGSGNRFGGAGKAVVEDIADAPGEPRLSCSSSPASKVPRPPEPISPP